MLADVTSRLTKALSGPITPRAVYNKVEPPNLTHTAHDANWTQPFSLLVQSARLLRKALTDAYFQRSFSGLSFTQDELKKAMNIFDDIILRKPDFDRAGSEIRALKDIEDAETLVRDKCSRVWDIISGGTKPSENGTGARLDV